MKKLIVLFVFVGCLLSSAWASEPTAKWGELPTYQFRSTSTCMTVVGNSSFASTKVYAPYCSAPTSKPRRETSNPWDDEGNPNGQGIGNVDTPIGSPMVLLLLAMLFGCYRAIRSYIWKTGKN